MATFQEFREDLTDKIIQKIFSDYENFDPEYYLKKIDPATGAISSESDSGNTVLYQEDYQEYQNEYDAFIDTLSHCACDSTMVYNDEGETTCSSTYTLVDSAQIVWSWRPEGGGTNSEGGDDWELHFEIPGCGVDADENGSFDVGTGGDAYYSIFITESILTFLSQFIGFDNTSPSIDPNKAKEILDTTIFELLPTQITRQERIDKVFSEINDLLGDVPEFNFDLDNDGINDTWNTNLETEQNNYAVGNDIIYNPTEGNIVRLDRTAEYEGSNTGQTLESLRNRLNDHLTDVDKKINPEVTDERPEYEEKAPGYVKIRNLNQSVIIRNQEGSDVGLIGENENLPIWLETGFTVTMWVKFLTKKQGGTLFNFGNPLRQKNPKGFMLETFVIHKDSKVREDKLYTWGDYINCHHEGAYDPALLEYCIQKEVYSDGATEYDWSEWFAIGHTFFKDSDYERFVRLVVRENPTETYPRGALRDSHTGVTFGQEGYIAKRIRTADPYECNTLPLDDCDQYSNMDDLKTRDASNNVPNFNGTIPTAPLWTLGNARYEGYDEEHYYPNKILAHTRIPMDFNEWFFIVANYNPNINEDSSVTYRGDCNPTDPNAASAPGTDCAPNAATSLKYASDFWRWNVERGGYVLNAGDALLDSNDNLSAGDAIGSFTHNYCLGAKCKVEIISNSDLLRSRGYKT